MRILVVSTCIFPTPPPGYGGLELVAASLAQELAHRGHQVTVMGAKGSLVPGCSIIAPEPAHPNDPEGAMFNPSIPRVKAREWDLVSDHSWQGLVYSLKADDCSWLPIVHTCHGMLPFRTPPPVSKPCIIGVSQWHRDFLSYHLKIPIDYAYNGVDIEALPLVKEKGDYAVFWARIMPEKGTLEAIHIGREGKKRGYWDRMLICGEDRFINDKNYLLEVMRQCDGRSVQFLGSVSRAMMPEILGRARVLINPIQMPYRDIFSLNIIEALAMGTPVLSSDQGAAQELLTSETGVVTPKWEDLLDAFPKVAGVSPEVCRKQAEKFGLSQMTDRYEELFKKALEEGGGW